MRIHTVQCSVILLACAIFSAAGTVQAQESAPRAQVLVLGTWHFDNPGLDVVKTEVADVLAAEKQTEIEKVVEALARFRPTRIAVEARRDQAERLDSMYAAYREKQHTLGRSELQQLGFRLAARFDHPRVYPIDHKGEFPFGVVMQYAQEHDTAFVERVQRVTGEIAAEKTRRQKENSVGEILRLENEPGQIARGHAMYMEFAGVGAGDTYVGSDLLAKWYARNIRIFSDLQKLAQPGERVLVIFGAGHAAILRELIGNDSRLELVEANDYLPAP